MRVYNRATISYPHFIYQGPASAVYCLDMVSPSFVGEQLILLCSVFFYRTTPPKRPAETNKESKEKRKRVSEGLNVEKDQTSVGPAVMIPPALIETLVNRVADEVTRRLQPQNTE